MQVAVVGAGAVGCYYGGLLARAGHHVTFIGRRTHVDAINAHGLLLDTQVFKRYLRARAATDASSLASPDLVLFCVKSADTEETGRSLAGRLRTEASVLSLQNGADNPQRLRAVTGHPVIPAVVYVGSEMVGPGHVKHHGGGALVIGASPESQTLAETLKAAEIQTTIADDIERIQWSKLATNCAFNACGGHLLRTDAEGRRHEGCRGERGAGSRDGRACMWRIDAGRPARTDTENSRRHADPDVIDRTGSRARQTKRDRLSQRLRRAERRRAGHSDSDQPCPSGDGEARGTEQ